MRLARSATLARLAPEYMVPFEGEEPFATLEDLWVKHREWVFEPIATLHWIARHVIDTITANVVLILGRFTPERKVVLDALRERLRQREYTPVLFDFDKPASKDLTGTVQTLAVGRQHKLTT